jgi:hypothetical protein
VSIGAVATLFDATGLVYFDESALNAVPPLAVYLPGGVFGKILVLGHHFLDGTGTPVFDLYSVNEILYGKKTGDVKAPATANKGPAGTGAVDWLQLTAKEGYDSLGLSLTYRVVTAGGKPLNSWRDHDHSICRRVLVLSLK